jgi:hypothetical protein
MKQFLFLYPVSDYFDFFLNPYNEIGVEFDMAKFQSVIDNRYRYKGYDINWLLFSKEGDRSVPDKSRIPVYIDIMDKDRILNAGVTLNEIASRKYPDSDQVLGQLPRHERLVTAGFHQWDCVDRISKRSYENGVDTFVDEDLTEKYFPRERLIGVPILRENWSPKELAIAEVFMELAKEMRKDKPWFTQF